MVEYTKSILTKNYIIDLPCVLTRDIIELASYCQVLSRGQVIHPSLMSGKEVAGLYVTTT